MFFYIGISWLYSTVYSASNVPDLEFGSGSGSFHQQAKNDEQPWFIVFCDFFMHFLSLKNYVNLPSKNNKHKNVGKKIR